MNLGGLAPARRREHPDPIIAISKSADECAAGIVNAEEPAGHSRKGDALAIHKRRAVGPGRRVEFQDAENSIRRGRHLDDRECPLHGGSERGKTGAERDRPAAPRISRSQPEPEVPPVRSIDDGVVGRAFLQPGNGRSAASRIDDRFLVQKVGRRRQPDGACREVAGSGWIEDDRSRRRGLPRFNRAVGEHLHNRAAHAHGSCHANQTILEGSGLGPREIDIGADGPHLNGSGRLDDRIGRQIHGCLRLLDRDGSRHGHVLGINRIESRVEMHSGNDRGGVIDSRCHTHAAAG